MVEWEKYVEREAEWIERACIECATASGYTPEQAEDCEDCGLCCQDCPFQPKDTSLTTRGLVRDRLRYLYQELDDLYLNAEAASEQQAEAVMNHVCSGFTRESFTYRDDVYAITQRITALNKEAEKLERGL